MDSDLKETTEQSPEEAGKQRKRRKRVRVILLVIAGVVALLIAGWNILLRAALNQMDESIKAPPPGADTIAAFDAALVDIPALTLPPETRIVALGEATHGNAEAFTLRRAILQRLAEAYGCRAFALEEDFAVAWKCNEFIINGQGTAEEAVNGLSFWLYKNQDMADLLQWMHDFNRAQPPGDEIRLYGFDIQSTDAERNAALACLALVDEAAAQEFRTRYITGKEDPQSITLELQEALKENRAAYIAREGEEAYLLAARYAQCLLYGLQRKEAENSFAFRDEAMAANVTWILEYERLRGREVLFISGHNGHTCKTSGYLQNEQDPYVMGSHLAARYGGAYYSIGMDVWENTFRANQNRSTYTLHNDGSEMIQAFAATGREAALLPVRQALEQPVLRGMLTTEQRICYGDAGPARFAKGKRARLSLNTLPVVPVQDFDAIAFLREATPPRSF